LKSFEADGPPGGKLESNSREKSDPKRLHGGAGKKTSASRLGVLSKGSTWCLQSGGSIMALVFVRPKGTSDLGGCWKRRKDCRCQILNRKQGDNPPYSGVKRTRKMPIRGGFRKAPGRGGGPTTLKKTALSCVGREIYLGRKPSPIGTGY